MSTTAYFFMGFSGTLILAGLAFLFFKRVFVSVYPGKSTLVMRFGRCQETLAKPGLYFRPMLLIPGWSAFQVTTQLDHRRFTDLHLNDRDGTTLWLDLWIEYQVKDPVKSVFAVEDWTEAMRGALLHELSTIVGQQRFEQVLRDRDAIVEQLLQRVKGDAASWGIEVRQAGIQEIRLLPEMAKHFYGKVAAKLDMQKARREEEGRIRTQELQAKTRAEIASLNATAKAQKGLAVSRAYRKLSKQPPVLKAYESLHQLSLFQPGRVVSFIGFAANEISSADAVMIQDSTFISSMEAQSGAYATAQAVHSE